jgi:hypothetical protein
MRRRSAVIIVGLAALLLAGPVGYALGAILLHSLSREAAPPGATVTLTIRMTGRAAGTDPGVLVLVPQGTYDEPSPCPRVDPSIAVADLEWHRTQLKFDGESYPGMESQTTFTVPDVMDGAYYLAETWPDQYTRCFTYASFTVDSTLPDSAMAPPRVPFVLLGLMVLLGGSLLGKRVVARTVAET